MPENGYCHVGISCLDEGQNPIIQERTLNQRRPNTPPARPIVQRVWIRYAKRSRLRFTSHRDFARAFERALRRAGVPMAYSAGFTPHPKVSYLGAAPTGVASEAEYLEIGLADRVDCDLLRAALDQALPAGLDVVECHDAGPGSLAGWIDASAWRIALPGVAVDDLRGAVERFEASESVEVERLTKSGRRKIDARAAVVTLGTADSATIGDPGASPVAPASSATPCCAIPHACGGVPSACAILELVVRQVTPAVRPDDVLAALRAVAGFVPPVPPWVTRMAQGRLDGSGRLADPLAPVRTARLSAPSVGTTPVG
ncbi:MAG TPA: TIGR03936 family radical SAM-associated protein [Mycobacteriales bacterium]|nr:TIGR03936 family radical SAM-associated protein [Mycobacteriales bacterium]